MSGKMDYVNGIMGKMKSVKYDLGYGHATPTISLVVQLDSRDDETYLEENYEPPWYC
jgi:hypothetical protein